MLFLPQKSIYDTDLILILYEYLPHFIVWDEHAKKFSQLLIALEANYMYFNQLIYVYFKSTRLGIILLSWIN
jgi:hypothetical protein